MYIKIFEYYREKLQLPENEILQVTINDLNRLKAPLEKLPNDTERMEVWEKMKALPYRDLNKELVKDKIIAKPKLKVTRCEHCNQLIIYYSQEDICVCKGTHAVFAMPIEA